MHIHKSTIYRISCTFTDDEGKAETFLVGAFEPIEDEERVIYYDVGDWTIREEEDAISMEEFVKLVYAEIEEVSAIHGVPSIKNREALRKLLTDALNTTKFY